MLNLNEYNEIILNLPPEDMRKGFDSLIAVAHTYLDKDTLTRFYNGKALLIFTSRKGNIMKVLGFDAKGSFIISRWLKKGGFQRLKCNLIGSPTMELTLFELEQYLDGHKIYVTR